MKINELDNVCAPEKQDRINEFCEWCCEQLGIDVPHLRMAPKNDTTALGYTDMSDGSVTVVVGDRHQMDIMRTLAHELVHVRQMGSYEPDGATGSDDENEANAMAGVLMREWGQNNPDLYTEGVNVEEGKNKGLWHNIRAKGERGEKPAKKGDKAYPKTLDVDEARLSMKKKKPSAQDRFNARLKDKHGIDLDANLAKYKEMMDRLSDIDSGAPKTKADESFGEPSAIAKKRAADTQQKNIDDKYVATVDSNSKAGIYKNTSEDLLGKFKKAVTQKKKDAEYDKKNTAYQKRSDARTDRATELDLRGGDRVANGDPTSLKNPSRRAHNKRTVDKSTSRYKDGYNLPRLPESVDQVDESKTARMMALITALGATYGLEDEARAFADQIQQNIHNAQTAEPNPGRPDPVTPGNMKPGSDRVMRPPVDEIAPAIAAVGRAAVGRAAVGRGVVKGVRAVAKGAGSIAKTAGTKMAINQMQKDISDDEANEASTTSQILKGAPGAPDGRPKSMREAVNVQSIKDEVMAAVSSGNAREMKRVSDTIAKRISDLMDLRGTAGEEVDAEIKKALPVLKKAQMMLRDKSKMTEEKTRIDKKCWKGKKIGNPKTKVKGGVRVNNCVPKE